MAKRISAFLFCTIAAFGCKNDDPDNLCEIGQINCDGTCVFLSESPLHCGECGNACPGVEMGMAVCVEGSCAFECDEGFEQCDGTCVDYMSDIANCGGCGVECADPGLGTVDCVDAMCEVSCNVGATVCGDECVNLDSDPRFCGACDNACGDDEVCAAGSCVLACPDGQTRCGDTCVDTSADDENCGACGEACVAPDGATVMCVDSECEATCTSGELCGGECLDTDTDPENCGGCGVVCSSANGTPSCDAGVCEIACDAGFDDCDGDVTNGCEVNTNTALDHCGGCGTVCGASMVCGGGTCASGCGALELCDMTCVDIETDVAHCGACGTMCGGPISGATTGNPACTDSACEVSCAGSNTMCATADGDACVDLDSDPQACGACETACGVGERCDAGSCDGDLRAPGLLNCGLGAGDANPVSDSRHCGGCGGGCGIGGACEAGACVSDCSEGMMACNRGLSTDCVDPMTDNANCGGCGVTCDAGETCSAGSCVEFIYASDCWECGNGNDFPTCCAGEDATRCLPEAATCS